MWLAAAPEAAAPPRIPAVLSAAWGGLRHVQGRTAGGRWAGGPAKPVTSGVISVKKRRASPVRKLGLLRYGVSVVGLGGERLSCREFLSASLLALLSNWFFGS